jgi:hypothetical protein
MALLLLERSSSSEATGAALKTLLGRIEAHLLAASNNDTEAVKLLAIIKSNVSFQALAGKLDNTTLEKLLQRFLLFQSAYSSEDNELAVSLW